MKMRLRRRISLLTGVALGAAGMYYLDPDRGRSRRVRTRDRIAAKRRRIQREQERVRRYEEGVVEGLAHAGGPEHGPADDQALVDRVKSELGPTLHADRVSLDAADGVVELRGELDDPAAIEQLAVRVQAVPGVRAVRSYLHLPGQPAPNKAAALDASRHAEPLPRQ
jgi:hypothetical protein